MPTQHRKGETQIARTNQWATELLERAMTLTMVMAMVMAMVSRMVLALAQDSDPVRADQKNPTAQWMRHRSD